MGTYIALAAPSDLHLQGSYREPYTDEVKHYASWPVVAVYVPKEPDPSAEIYFVLSNGKIVKASEVKVDKDNGLDAIVSALDDVAHVINTAT